MMNLLQSPLLQALGLALANSLWQAALLWLLCFLAMAVFSPKASQKYGLVVAATFTALAWFVFTTVSYYTTLHAAANTSTGNFELENSATHILAASNWHPYVHALLPWISCAYMLIVLLLATRLINGFKTLKKLSTTQHSKPPVHWRLYVKKYAGILQIGKPVQVWMSSMVQSPLTIGFWKPIILLPIAGMNHLTTQQVESILLHELSHIRRHDYLLNIALQIVEILMFFNPFIRLLLKQAYQERENSCDDWVLQFNYPAGDYAKALLSIQQNASQHVLALGATNQRSYYLLNRIKRIIHPEKNHSHFRSQWSTLGMVLLTLLLVNGVAPVFKSKQAASSKAVLPTGNMNLQLAAWRATGLRELKTAAEAFSVARLAAQTRQQLPSLQFTTQQQVWSNSHKVMNMVTEEEAAALAAGQNLPAAIKSNIAATSAPVIIEANQPADWVQAQQAIQDYNRTAQWQQKALEQVQQQMQLAEQEIAQSKYRLHSKHNISRQEEESILNNILQKEKQLAEMAAKIAKEFAAIDGLNFSYSFDDITSAERQFETGNSTSSATLSHPNKYYNIVRGDVLTSKDKKKITIQLSGHHKEISISMPTQSGLTPAEILKQLEDAGVISIENQKSNTATRLPYKKTRTIVSL